MSALEIKPGKYRTRGGLVVLVESIENGVAYIKNGWQNHARQPSSWWADTGSFNDLKGQREPNEHDLIERIEDEPTGTQRQHVSDAAWEAIVAAAPHLPFSRTPLEDARRMDGTVLLTVAEHDELLALRAEVRRLQQQCDMTQSALEESWLMRRIEREYFDQRLRKGQDEKGSVVSLAQSGTEADSGRVPPVVRPDGHPHSRAMASLAILTLAPTDARLGRGNAALDAEAG